MKNKSIYLKFLQGGSVFLFTSTLCGNPTSYEVIHGDVAIKQMDPSTLEIQASDRSILHWQEFSIGQGETTRFIQPTSDAAVLNRVVGGDISSIMGRLEANGNVYLVNPNGIIISKEGIIDTNSFIGIALDMPNDAFLERKDLVCKGGGDYDIAFINAGTIKTKDGSVVLVGYRVTNEGLIQSENGNVTLAAGSEVILRPEGQNLLSIVSRSGEGFIENHKDLYASSLYSLAVAQEKTNEALHLSVESGRVFLTANKLTNYGEVKADEKITAHADASYVETVTGHLTAPSIVVEGERLFSSGEMKAESGAIHVLGKEIVLAGATLDASGLCGGEILIGGDVRGENPEVRNAKSVHVNHSTSIKADGQEIGGKVVLFSEGETRFEGSISAKGGSEGGFVEVSGKEGISSSDKIDVTASHGKAGQVLFDPDFIIISSSGTIPYYNLVDPNAGSGSGFGSQIISITGTNNIAVSKSFDSTTAPSAGRVYLYNAITGALQCQIFGTHASDEIGSGTIVVVGSGSSHNIVIPSPTWNSQVGASTWVSGISVTSGSVSPSNSYVGTTNTDDVGSLGVTVLSNGNYIVNSPNWSAGSNLGYGAATWGSGTVMGILGTVTSGNSLIGSNNSDKVSSGGTVALVGNGNAVVLSPLWTNEVGAATFINGTTGLPVGLISSAISLVGNASPDRISSGGCKALSNGNYVVSSPAYQSSIGSFTWGNGTATNGTTGTVSSSNSMVGLGSGDQISSGGIFVLNSSNYVVASPLWQGGVNNGLGAATWANGTGPTTGTVSGTNSLVGISSGDQISSGGVLALGGGNYVVISPLARLNSGSDLGAVTWGNGTVSPGIIGTVSSSNSITGQFVNDKVGLGGVVDIPTQGIYAVLSPLAISGIGAVTMGNSDIGTSGSVSTSNSFTGQFANDQISSGGAFVAGNMLVVLSPHWNSNAGAVTALQATVSNTGSVSTSNSLWGFNTGNSIDYIVFSNVTSSGETAYVVSDQTYNSNRGIATWLVPQTTIGEISAATSISGTNPGDRVGAGLYLTSDNNYLVTSNYQGTNGNQGSITMLSGSNSIVNETISELNSFIGSYANDQVGYVGNFLTFSAGNSIFASTNWNSGTGAVTWIGDNVVFSTSGTVSAVNSIIGSQVSAGLQSPISLSVPNTHSLYSATFANEGSGSVSIGLVDPSTIEASFAGSNTLTLNPEIFNKLLTSGTSINLSANQDITLESGLSGVGGLPATGSLFMTAGRNININSSAALNSGQIFLTATNNITGSSGSLSTTSGNIALNATNDVSGTIAISSTSGDVQINGVDVSLGSNVTTGSTGSINIQASDNVTGTNCVLTTSQGNITVTATNNISGTLGVFSDSGSLSMTATNMNLGSNIYTGSGNMSLIAQQDILSSSSITFSATSGNMTFVVDNANPSSVGPNYISVPNVTFTNNSGTLRIFTSQKSNPSQQLPAFINGVKYDTTSHVNTPRQQWDTFYPSSFGGVPYTVFYKESLTPPPPPPPPPGPPPPPPPPPGPPSPAPSPGGGGTPTATGQFFPNQVLNFWASIGLISDFSSVDISPIPYVINKAITEVRRKEIERKERE